MSARLGTATPRRRTTAGERPGVRGLDHLWSPWRMEYIDRATRTARRGSAPQRSTRDACLFCRVSRAPSRDREHFVLARAGVALLMLNRFPYNPAHLMVTVRRHVPRLADLDAGERRDLMDLAAVAERALEAEYRPDGFNIGINLGRVAGAGFPGHVHLHVVPRWAGDTNFMPVVGVTRVLPESLARTWSRLRRALRATRSSAP